jgi:alkyl hydroperoxide reductase subunit F
MAKEFLSKEGFEYIAYDVTKDKDALKEMIEVSGGARSVPVISVCNNVIVGFDPDRLKLDLNCLKQSTRI